MMRQYELVERVRALQPQHRREPPQPRLRLRHAGAWPAEARLGRGLFRPSARGRGDPDRPEARRRDDRRGGPARHDRGHRGDARGDQPQLRAADRRARRRPHQDRPPRPRLEARRAGRELPQAPAGDRRRRARAAGQARRPAAQHAHARLHVGRQAPAHRRGDPRHLCAARRPHGHPGDARRARGPRLPPSQPGSLRDHQPAPARFLGEKRARGREHRARADEEARLEGRPRQGQGAREAALLDLAQDGAQIASASSSFPTSSGSASSSTRSTSATRRSASSTPPGRWCPGASRTTSRPRSRTTTARSTRP